MSFGGGGDMKKGREKEENGKGKGEWTKDKGEI
jgi:hypothetical protein